MSFKMKQQPQTPHSKEVFVGPRNEEQKPKLCSHCGQPIALAYRVISREIDKKTGVMRITKGQYEVAHIKDGVYVFEGCPYPSLLEQLEMRIERERSQTVDLNVPFEQVSSGKGTKTVHRQVDAAENISIRVVCGAKGTLWTTTDDELVNCRNCKTRMAVIPNENKEDREDRQEPSQDQDQTGGSTVSEAINRPKVSKEEIKARIEAAKAAKASGGGKVGKSATLLGNDDEESTVEKDAEGLPIPQATMTKAQKKGAGAVVRQQVQKASKQATGNGMLNLCGCGCATPCKSNFIPGHDAKLHGWMRKLEQGRLELSAIPAQVRDGMYSGVKQGKVKGEDGKLELAGVRPTTDEKTYLGMLKGKGGKAE